ncbi:MAG TPA: hypothetical protein EYH30_02765 [Anaerolineales bacterium]|nr:hypothetical protein [Anaerolineales bacterium]
MQFLADQDVYQVTIEWLRITPTPVEGVHRELGRLVREYAEEQLRELFCVVEPNRYRIRRLRSI